MELVPDASDEHKHSTILRNVGKTTMKKYQNTMDINIENSW